MRILIIEDDLYKLRQITEFVEGVFNDAKVDCARSYQSGLKAAFSKTFDLILLDMSLPTFDVRSGEDGYKFIKLAGLDILAELRRKKSHSKVIVVTQFDSFGEGADYVELATLKERMRENFGQNYLGAVYYEGSQSRWKTQLKKMMLEVKASIHD